jgi:glycosyltransferase involved in cell wall biosynthesis
MKIALVSPHTLPVCRGNSLTVQRLCDGLLKRGHSVRLFNSTADVPEELVSFAPDLMHSLHALQPHAWLQQSGMLGTCPWVVTMTGTDYNSGVESEALQALSDARALIVFHSEAAARVRERFADLSDRVHIIPQAVQVPEQMTAIREDARRAWNLAPDEVVIFMAAGLRPVKNIAYALEAFSRFKQKHPQARMLLAGPCLDTQEGYQVLAAGEGMDGFSYLGELPHERVLELMQAADIFLNTSLHEGMPGAVMEAMAAGLAVIATDVPGNRALIASMRTGVLVPLHAPRVLSEAFQMLAARAELRQQLGRHAREEVQARYGCEAELQALEALYAKVLMLAGC